MIFIQKTKLSQVDDSLCKCLWGSGNFMFSLFGSNGVSGGILFIWEENFFLMESFLTTFKFVLIQSVVKPLN
ncbi:hypothetical protein CRYUN_Cryun25bG0062600 [Craigia yunnanensis]